MKDAETCFGCVWLCRSSHTEHQSCALGCEDTAMLSTSACVRLLEQSRTQRALEPANDRPNFFTKKKRRIVTS
jgi:hypothetical protein